MKKFTFGLERVLRVRKIQQALKLAEQKRAERALTAQQQRLAMFAGERDLQCLSMEEAQSREHVLSERAADWRYLQRIERIVHYQRTVVNDQERITDDAKRKFMQARQSCLSMEKLHEKKRGAWSREFLQEEQKSADDRPRLGAKDKL